MLSPSPYFLLGGRDQRRFQGIDDIIDIHVLFSGDLVERLYDIILHQKLRIESKYYLTPYDIFQKEGVLSLRCHQSYTIFFRLNDFSRDLKCALSIS